MKVVENLCKIVCEFCPWSVGRVDDSRAEEPIPGETKFFAKSSMEAVG